jgi:ComF family protein
MIRLLRDSLLSILFPSACTVCGGSVESWAEGPACSECWRRTKFVNGDESACAKCGLILNERPSGPEGRCGRCSGDLYDRAVHAALYHNAARAVVLQMKEEPYLAPRARESLLRRFDTSGLHSHTLLVPVPLSKKRMMERGFNQAEILARAIEEHTGIPLANDVLERGRHFAMHRAGMDKKARDKSVKKAFAVRRPRKVSGERIVLVDDVYTTGSTASACADVMKNAGAKEVSVFTFARTLYY